MSFFNPAEVEPVMDAAGEEVDHAVGGLRAGQVAFGLGVGGVHREGPGPSATVQDAGLAVGKKLFHRPAGALVIA